MSVLILQKLLAEFKTHFPNEALTNSSIHNLDLALTVANQFLIQRLRGPAMFWHVVADAVMEEFEPNSKEKPCLNAQHKLSVDTAFADSCRSKAAPSMIAIRSKLEKWHQGDRLRLNRFISPQLETMPQVIEELSQGRKRTHWMWYIFPQVKGLAQSKSSQHYGLQDRQEIEDYLESPLLSLKLIKCTQLVINHSDKLLEDIFPYPDNLKFISCMTAFAIVQTNEPIFDEALNLFNEGKYCNRTVELLADIEPHD